MTAQPATTLPPRIRLAANTANTSPQLPALREDIDLHPGKRDRDGAPSWVLHDPAANAFFRIGWCEFEVLSRWHMGYAAHIIKAVNSETTLTIAEDEITAIALFLAQHNLVKLMGPDARRSWLAARDKRCAQSALRLGQGVLFPKFPLFRPQRLLERLARPASLLYTRAFLGIVLGVTVLASYLVSRQWDTFLTTFPHLFSLAGAVTAMLAIFFAKLVHEFGHAFTATRYGVRVPTMGIALILFWPVLYTETSEAWKLPRRDQRLKIGAAGMAAEMVLAAFALLAWSFLDPGPLRSAVFILATVTWILTLAINLNPLVRFDGYYLMSDLLGIENLQGRAFELGKWRLRSLLFHASAADPEPSASASTRRILLVYFVAACLYRVVLFGTIALFLYMMFFKALGVVLAGAVIVLFLIKPVAQEIVRWFTGPDRARLTVRTAASAGLVSLVLLLVFIPWRTTVEAPALASASVEIELFPPFASRLAEIHVNDGQAVSKGDLLFVLEAPDIRHALAQAERRSAALATYLSRQAARRELLEERLVLAEQLAEIEAEVAGHLAQLNRLRILAPHDGRVVDLNRTLRAGLWLRPTARLALFVGADSDEVVAYPDERDLMHLGTGSEALFYEDGSTGQPRRLRLEAVEKTATATLADPMLASSFGGAIATRTTRDGELVPEGAVYRARFVIVGNGDGQHPERVARGTIRMEGERQSLAERLFARLAAVILRESGF